MLSPLIVNELRCLGYRAADTSDVRSPQLGIYGNPDFVAIKFTDFLEKRVQNCNCRSETGHSNFEAKDIPAINPEEICKFIIPFVSSTAVASNKNCC